MKEIKLTYFTPTYNREKLLPKLYESLLSQTNKNFIWLVIDDGSTDNTEQIVKNWQKQAKINIEYIKKENGGKHTAIELSNQICTTEYICCVDSDDYLTNNATEVLYSYFHLCEKNNIIGLLGPKNILNSQTSTTWDLQNTEMFFYDLNKHFKTIPETTLVFKTELCKKYHFPIFSDEKFVTESVYYKQFFYDYKFVTFSENIYVAEYQPDGYTNMGMNLFVKNPKGYACCLKQDAFLSFKQNKKSFIKKLKLVMRYYGWKSLFKIKQDVMPEYKLNWFYKLIGTTTNFIYKLKIKKELKK
jgi:glycosyltransferase involved in cell wall biosynthesis